jgi:DNA-binding NtrC family response regulator
MAKILVVDDEKLIRKSLKVALEDEGFGVYVAETGAEGLSIAKKVNIDLVLLDIRLPDINGIDVLKMLKDINADLIVVMMTGYGTVDSAVLAMKSGAFDYINKPFKAKNVTSLIKLAIETHSLQGNVKRFIEKDKIFYGLDRIIGQSDAIRQILDMIKKVAQIDSATVLIEGESGTGKELVAKAIHYNSSRCNAPFVEINCSAIPSTLLESELFGYEQGAFTDARKAKKGLVEQANGGSLFLDEIGDMDAAIQAKILGVLQERKFRRLGGDKVMEMDVRIIAATNYDLRHEIRKKNFREDLFYRLNVVHISLPPLRDRKGDIILLTKYFINEFNELFNKNVKGISPDAMDLLMRYSWSGNVRELRNIIERIMIIENPEIIGCEHIPVEIASGHGNLLKTSSLNHVGNFEIPDEGIDIKELTNSFQAMLVRKALQKSDGKKEKAARLLNIDRFSLRYLMNKLNPS